MLFCNCTLILPLPTHAHVYKCAPLEHIYFDLFLFLAALFVVFIKVAIPMISWRHYHPNYIPYLPEYKSIPCISRPPIFEAIN